MTCEDDDYDTQALSVCRFLLRDSWLGVWTSHKLFQNQTTCRPRSTFPNLSGPTPQPPLSLTHTRSHHIRTKCSISLLEGQHFRPVSFHPRFHGLIIYGAGPRGLNPAHINARAHSETQTVRLLVFASQLERLIPFYIYILYPHAANGVSYRASFFPDCHRNQGWSPGLH